MCNMRAGLLGVFVPPGTEGEGDGNGRFFKPSDGSSSINDDVFHRDMEN